MDVKTEFIVITLLVIFVGVPAIIAMAYSIDKRIENNNSFISKLNRFVGVDTRKGGYFKKMKKRII